MFQQYQTQVILVHFISHENIISWLVSNDNLMLSISFGAFFVKERAKYMNLKLPWNILYKNQRIFAETEEVSHIDCRLEIQINRKSQAYEYQVTLKYFA